MAEPAPGSAAASTAGSAPAPPGTARYLVWLYCDPQERSRLAALFEIEREVLTSLRPGLDHGVAHARLAWWREEFERLAAALPRHPQAVTLLREMRRAGAPAPDLSPLVAAASWDLASAAPTTRAELELRCAHWGAGVFRFVSIAAGDVSAGGEELHPGGADRAAWLAETGALIEELNLLGAMRDDARRGRLRAPLAELEAIGVAADAVAAETWTAPLARYAEGRHRELRRRLAGRLTELAPAARPGLRNALVWCELAANTSLRVSRALPHHRQPGRFDPLRDTWSAWRAARRALAAALPPGAVGGTLAH